jgi:hypothetical protein
LHVGQYFTRTLIFKKLIDKSKRMCARAMSLTHPIELSDREAWLHGPFHLLEKSTSKVGLGLDYEVKFQDRLKP